MVAQRESGSHALADDLGSDPIMRREPMYRNDPGMVTRRSSRESSQIRRAPNSAGLYDILDLILDKGIVIDAFVRVSLVGIELVTVDLRVVIASVDTYLRYAEGVERLGTYDRGHERKLPDMVSGGMKLHAASKGAEKLEKGAERVGKAITGRSRHEDDEDDRKEEDDNEGEGLTGTIARGVRNTVGKIVDTFTGGDDDDDDRGERQPQRGRDQAEHREHRERQGNGRGGQPVKAGARK